MTIFVKLSTVAFFLVVPVNIQESCKNLVLSLFACNSQSTLFRSYQEGASLLGTKINSSLKC